MNTLTIKDQVYEIPEDIKFFSQDQEEDYKNVCFKFYKAHLSNEEKERVRLELYPLFAAMCIQPIRDKFYNMTKVIELWNEIKNCEEKTKIVHLGMMFCMSVGKPYLQKELDSNRSAAKAAINKFRSN
jgi:hypothetical protein